MRAVVATKTNNALKNQLLISICGNTNRTMYMCIRYTAKEISPIHNTDLYNMLLDLITPSTLALNINNTNPIE